jgi:hypothetical protein
MEFIIGILVIFIISLLIEKGWHLPEGWAMRATVITIGIIIVGIIAINIYNTTHPPINF